MYRKPDADGGTLSEGEEGEEEGEEAEGEADGEAEAKEAMERLRRYELERMRYYFAVVVCDSIRTADQLYTE